METTREIIFKLGELLRQKKKEKSSRNDYDMAQ